MPSTIVTWKKSGIYPSDRGIYPRTIGIKLDLCFCTIPTVGLYGKLGEITATHFSSNIKHIHGAAAATRRRAASIVANRRGCRQWILLQLAMRGGKACQYFWRLGSSSIEAFVWGDAQLTRDDAVPSPIIGDAIATTERR